MLRCSATLRCVSAFSVYLKHLGDSGVLKGVRNPTKRSSKMYRQLSSPERKIYEQRARRLSYPALDAYNRFQKEMAPRFIHLSNKQRQRKVAQLWTDLKTKGSVSLPKIPKAASRKLAKAAKLAAKAPKGAVRARRAAPKKGRKTRRVTKRSAKRAGRKASKKSGKRSAK